LIAGFLHCKNMATDKKKVVVYCDWIETFESLTDEEAGRLIKHFFRYVNDLNPTSDRLVELMFTPIKQTLKRDLQSWNAKRSKNSENGKLGGRPKKSEENPNKANGYFKNPIKAKKAVSDSDSVSVSDIVINKYRAFAHLSMSIDEYKKLEADYTKQQIDNALDSIENFKQNTKYKSLYLTCKNWLSKEPKKDEVSKQQKSIEQLQYEHVMKQMELNKTR
jgi:hypothetical protein